MGIPAATVLLAFVRHFKTGGIIVNEHTLTRSQTSFHVQVLGRWFEFISLEQLPGRLASRRKKPFCLMTFDDGKRSNFSEAAPELERLGVPAVFYVPTEPLANGSCLWFDRRAKLVSALGRCPAGLELNELKELPLDVLSERLERACAQCEFGLREETDDLRPMTWAEARTLNRLGFTIGAHGVTHAILTRESKQRAFLEIERSLARVTLELSAPCTTFAFPNGNYTAELAHHALHCGATTLMTTEPMWADHNASLWCLPRIQLFGGATRAQIELKVALAAFKGILANPDGSGRRYRSARKSWGTLSPSFDC